MLWATALTTSFSFCRSGEIMVENQQKYNPAVHLSFGDIATDDALSPTIVSLNMKMSKTDQG